MESLRIAASKGLRELLADALSAGFFKVGQIVFRPTSDGFRLCHVDDEARTDLQLFTNAEEAAGIALFDDANQYRPLKTAPNLKHGWELCVPDLKDLHLALDLLYPAALGNWRALLLNQTVSSPLRDTVNRQTGMYRITGLITDEEAQGLIEKLCQPGCLRQIQWPIPSESPHHIPSLKDLEIPLLCTEACCLLIAEARTTVKSRKPQ